MSACHHTLFQIKAGAASCGTPLFVYITILMIASCHSSTFDATSSSQWLGQTIDCQSGQPCNVTCDMTSSCKQATINCPTDAECRVDCTANSACDSATITWPTQAGLGFLDCVGDYACRGIEFPIPDPTTPLSPRCMKGYECANATLYCPTAADCAIHCHYNYACYGTTVNWPSADQDHSHTIKCGYGLTCLGLSFEPVLDDYYEAFVRDWYANEEIICNDNKPCTVKCAQDRACLNATIQCPANNVCDVQCDAADACSRTEINCPPNSACSVTCTDSSACYKADITWPLDSQLGTLNCHGTMDMVSAGPDGGDPICKQSVFSSSRNNQFKDQDMVCVDDVDCAIYCNHDYACSANIICPPHHECNITCTDTSSCRGANITCPTDAPCNVVCTATYACYQANIEWPTLPGLGTIECGSYESSCNGIGEFPIPNQNEALYVHCNNHYECANNTITCPPYGDCTVYCFYPHSCMGMTVDWGINYRENGYAQTMGSCYYDTACIGMTFLPVLDDYYEAFVKYQYQDEEIICNDDKPCNVLCHEHSSCKNSVIQCPPHSDCNIECTAVSACQSASITCPVDANCTIACTASGACDWASIRWSEPGSGSIDCVGTSACRGIATAQLPFNETHETVIASVYSTVLRASGRDTQIQTTYTVFIAMGIVFLCIVMCVLIYTKHTSSNKAFVSDVNQTGMELNVQPIVSENKSQMKGENTVAGIHSTGYGNDVQDDEVILSGINTLELSGNVEEVITGGNTLGEGDMDVIEPHVSPSAPAIPVRSNFIPASQIQKVEINSDESSCSGNGEIYGPGNANDEQNISPGNTTHGHETQGAAVIKIDSQNRHEGEQKAVARVDFNVENMRYVYDKCTEDIK